jgi:hypothetical protein
MFLRNWIISALKKGDDGNRRVPYYVTGDGIAYTRADEVLRSPAVQKQLQDVRKLRELARSDHHGAAA